MKGQSIYISGATGFIGRNLIPSLLNMYKQVINFTRRETIQIYSKNNVVEQKVCTDFIKRNPSNEFINLATLYVPNPSSISEMKDLLEANILFPMHTLEFLRALDNLKIINALSYTQLLDFPNQNIYSLTKEIFKKFLFFNKSSKILSLYLFDTFGEGDIRNKVTDVFIRNILSGSPITIPENEVNINLTHNSVIAESFLQSIALDPGDYCVKSPNTISLESLAVLIMDITGKETKIFKKNSVIDPFKFIKSYPENIFKAPEEYNFNQLLENRIQEIIKSES
jgi:nucleoside-diphosphate-sugar epimerase